MSRVFAKASTQSLSGSFSAVTGVPMTMACWSKPTDFSTHQCLMDVGVSGNGGNRFRLHHVQTSGAARCLSYGTGTVGFATSTTNPSTGVWSHLCGVFTSTASRTVYLNGGSSATDTTSITTLTTNTLFIGRGDWSSSSAYFPFGGSVIWPAIWNVALASDEVASLAAGAHPTMIRPDALVFFAPLGGFDGDHDIDIVGGLSLAANNSPTWSDDSPSGLVYSSVPIVGLGTTSPPVSSIAPHVMHYRRMMTG